MKKRQIKKINATAKQLLEKIHPNLEFAKIDKWEACEKVPTGTWVIWIQTSYEYNEWDFETAYSWLSEMVYWEFMVADWSAEGADIKFTPDTSTPRKVFDLAKKSIERGIA